MANQIFHSKLTIQAGTASTDAVTKSQLDAAEAAAKDLGNATGTLTHTSISDWNTEVDSRIQLIVDSAPGALDTLNELAAALGDDPDFSGTVTTALGDLDDRLDIVEAAVGGSAGNYATNIGDAVASTFTVTHSLATLDVRVEVVQISNGQTVYPVVTRGSTNTVALDFGTTVPSSASHRVLVTKVA